MTKIANLGVEMENLHTRIVGTLKRNPPFVKDDSQYYHLMEHIWYEVRDDWPYFTEEERLLIIERKKSKISALQSEVGLREKLINFLAVRPYKCKDISTLIDKVATHDRDKNEIRSMFKSIVFLKEESYHLTKKSWKEVKVDWPLFTEEERLMVNQRIKEKQEQRKLNKDKSHKENPEEQIQISIEKEQHLTIQSKESKPENMVGKGKYNKSAKGLRELLIHSLAVKQYKKEEIVTKITNDGVKIKNLRSQIIGILKTIAFVKDESQYYHLMEHIWYEVMDDWSFFTEEERLMVIQRKSKVPELESGAGPGGLREQLIHFLAVKPYKRDDISSLMNKVETHGSDKNQIQSMIKFITIKKDDAYHLTQNAWKEVKVDWHLFSKEEQCMVNQRMEERMETKKEKRKLLIEKRLLEKNQQNPSKQKQPLTEEERVLSNQRKADIKERRQLNMEKRGLDNPAETPIEGGRRLASQRKKAMKEKKKEQSKLKREQKALENPAEQIQTPVETD